MARKKHQYYTLIASLLYLVVKLHTLFDQYVQFICSGIYNLFCMSFHGWYCRYTDKHDLNEVNKTYTGKKL